MDVAIVSDTHIPSRAHAIPDAFRERIAAADHAIHAGDVDSDGALADLLDLAGDLTAVSGNMDRSLGLPDVATVEFDGVSIVVTHGHGSPAGYEQRIVQAAQQRDGDVVVAGHTHEVVDRTSTGVRVLNPGSATGAVPADRPTMMTATAEEGALDVTVHER